MGQKVVPRLQAEPLKPAQRGSFGLAAARREYLNSPGHRKNIMDGGFDRMGAGVARSNCFGYPAVFAVQVFLDQR